MPELLLNEPQRRAVGVRLRAINGAVQTLRRAGLDHDRLDAIERLVGDAAALAQVPPPLPEPSLVAAMIAEILIDATELRPRNLRRYGEIDDDTGHRLEALSGRLTELVDALDVFEPAT